MTATAAFWWMLTGIAIGLAVALVAFVWWISTWKWPG